MSNTNKIVYSAMFSALIYVSTAFLRLPVPMPSGYIHLGDTFIFVACYYFGGIYGIAASAIGAALADVTLGFSVYALPTLAVKSAMAITLILLFKVSKKIGWSVLWMAAASVVMLIGYFITDIFLVGASYAFTSMLTGILQPVASIPLAVSCIAILNKARVFNNT